MPNITCIPVSVVDELKARFRSGKIDVAQLEAMGDVKRNEYFAALMGKETATKINALFESKLLLKNQQQGMITWAKNVMGMSPEAKKDIVSKIERMTEILKPSTKREFYADLAEQKLGVRVTEAEAANIVDMAAKVKQLEAKMNPDYTFNSEAERIEYGLAKTDFVDHVATLKHSVKKPLTPTRAITTVGGITKSLKATFDNSVIAKQGLRTLFTHPKIWAKNALKTYSDAYKSFRGEDTIRAVKADLYSRPNFLNGNYTKEGLAVGVIEEAFPTSLPEKIPLLGRVFKASESAFVGFQYRTRADVFDKYVEIAERTGADIKGIGRLVNSLTGRGHLGSFEPSANVLNTVFFSPRFFVSHVDALTAHGFGTDPKMGKFAKQQAVWNLARTITGIAGILGVAEAVNPDSVDWNPLSSNFGKIKIGNTRFDVTGGMGSIVTLASRAMTWHTKSSTTGVVTQLNQPGGATVKDALYNFAENKAAPITSLLLHLAAGKDFSGNPMTVTGALVDLLAPMPLTNIYELLTSPDSANILLALLLDSHGVSTNTYTPTRDWNSKTSKEMLGFKKKVGQEKFNQAYKEFNVEYSNFVERTVEDKRFKDLKDSKAKLSALESGYNRIKKSIFAKYGYASRREPKKSTQTFI